MVFSGSPSVYFNSQLHILWKDMMTISFIVQPVVTIASVTSYLLPSLSTMHYEMLVMACQ